MKTRQLKLINLKQKLLFFLERKRTLEYNKKTIHSFIWSIFGMFSFLTSASADRKAFQNLHGADWTDGAAACFSCEQPFSMTRRRHHCRRCGKECCNTCSAMRLDELRACVFCFVSHKIASSPQKHTNPHNNNNEENAADDTNRPSIEVTSDRDTLPSFVYNHSLVSMADMQEDGSEYAGGERMSDFIITTPSRDFRDYSNSHRIDGESFLAPWAVTPSTDGSPTPVRPQGSGRITSPVVSDQLRANLDENSENENGNGAENETQSEIKNEAETTENPADSNETEQVAESSSNNEAVSNLASEEPKPADANEA